jgi:hypothetical protein
MVLTKTLKIESIILLDIIALVFMYFIPAISHLTSYPMYKLEPMRCILLVNLLLIGNKKNACIMAATLPLFSFAVASHPVLIKSVIMAIELVANIILFFWLSEKKMNIGFAMFLSIIASKLLYYVLKFLLIKVGVISLSLVDTNILVQLVVAFIISLLFVTFQKEKKLL